MAIRQVWLGSVGPFIYDDEEAYPQEPSEMQRAVRGFDIGVIDNVNIVDAVNAQVLVFDSDNEVWVNANLSEIISSNAKAISWFMS